MKNRFARVALQFALVPALAAAAIAADWPQWRGPDGNGTSTETGLISTWSPTTLENVVFRVPIIGRSTPAVFDGRVCASARAEGRLEVVACFSAKDGTKLWERQFPVYNTTIPYTRVGWAAVSGDPETGYLYAQNGDGQLIAFDREGKTVWEIRLGEEMGRSSGYGGRTHSPLIDDDSLIVSIVGGGWGQPLRQRYTSFNKRTGEVEWISTPSSAPVEDFNNNANAVVAIVGGERLMIAGGADGWIYALRARTGELVWTYQFSTRSLNAPVTVRDGVVYANQSEEPLDGGFMGQVIAIDGTLNGDITQTGRKWNADGIGAGFAAPLLDGNRVYVVTNSGHLNALDARTGEELYSTNLGTIGRGSAVLADGKIYATEVNGNIYILKPHADRFETLSHVELKMPEDGRHVEVWGSFAVAYGRLYLLTENYLYCLGDKNAAYTGPAPGAPATVMPWPAALPAANLPLASIALYPAETTTAPGETVSFEVRGFDAKGRSVTAPAATYSLTGLAGSVAGGVFTPDPTRNLQAGQVVAKVGDFTANARVRVFGPLPWSEDFESGRVPAHWVGAGRLAIGDSPEGKILTKGPAATGLNRLNAFIGLATMKGYTIEADVRATRNRRRMGDVGLMNHGYTLDMRGVHQQLQIRSWAAELAFSKEVPFTVESDVWYRMRLAVEPGSGKTTVRGKVWKRSDPEPSAWTIEFEDPVVIPSGAPGLYGDSSTDIAWDNLKVIPNR